MKRAKDILGDVCCIAGNIPTSILAVGTPTQVKNHCNDLIEYCGKDGGFWLSSGAIVDQAKPENIHALIEAAKEYGV